MQLASKKSPFVCYVALATFLVTLPLKQLCGDDVISRLGHNRFLHGRQVHALAFSPDSTKLISGSDKNAIIWDRKTGEAIHTLVSETGPCLAVQFSRDGKLAATGTKNATAQIWNAETGQVIHTLRLEKGAVKSVDFNSDSSILATGDYEGAIRLWDTKTGVGTRELRLESGSVNAVAFSPDGKTLLAGSSRPPRAILWNWETGDQVASLESPRVNVTSVCFSPDGKHIAAAANNSVDIWDAESGKREKAIAAQVSRVSCVCYDTTGKVVLTGSIDRMIRGWSTETGKKEFESKGHAGMIQRLAFSPDGKAFASCGLTNGSHAYDYTIRLWDPATGSQLPLTTGVSLPLESVAISPNGKLVATSHVDQRVKIWDADSGKLLREWIQEENARGFPKLAFSPDGKTLATTMKSSIGLWNVGTGKMTGTIAIGRENTCIAFSPDGKTVTVGNTHSAFVVCDVAGERILRHCTDHSGKVLCVAYSPDSQTIASVCQDGYMRLWHTGTGRLVQKYGNDGARSVTFSRDGRLIASVSKYTLLVKEVITGSTIARIVAGQGNAVVFANDFRTVVTGNDNNEMNFWDLSSGESYLSQDSRHGSWTSGMQRTPDGRRLVIGSSDGTAIVWNLEKTVATKRKIDKPTPDAWTRAWSQMNSDDAAKAYRAMWIVRADETATIKKVGETFPLDVDESKDNEIIARLIRQLDANKFDTREQAMKSLIAYGPKARTQLEIAWRDTGSVEQRYRVAQLLKHLDRAGFQPLKSPAALLRQRSIQLLEYMGTAEAEKLLQRIAERSTSTLDSATAKASLDRLRNAKSAQK